MSSAALQMQKKKNNARLCKSGALLCDDGFTASSASIIAFYMVFVKTAHFPGAGDPQHAPVRLLKQSDRISYGYSKKAAPTKPSVPLHGFIREKPPSSCHG